MITPCGLLRAFKSLNSPQGVVFDVSYYFLIKTFDFNQEGIA